MPRWKALPEELDPEVSEFTLQLRGLVDRSGLSIAAVGDRTGYSKTSWERYLNGRLLAPKGAIVALAEVTGTHQAHLITMWELAERAWSRSEMRHDMTMEAIRISQARQALGEFSPGAAGSTRGPDGSGGPKPKPGSGGRGGRAPGAAGATIDFGAGARGGRPGVGPVQGPGLGQGPGAVPQQRGPGGTGQAAPGQAYGGYGGYGPAGAPGAVQGPARQGGPGGPGGQGGPGGPAGPGPGRPRRRALVFGAAIVGALVVAGGALLMLNLGGDGDTDKTVAQSPTPTPSASKPVLPEGVECSGDDCTGKDPEEMGCGGQYAETVSSATVGTTLVEVRYSKTCGAAWARITQAAIGDEVRISSLRATGEEQTGTVETTADAYTPMAAVPDADSAKACATLVNGTKGCTTAE